ncbi:nucleolin isoform X1 [Erpetoichthys calabaricus]|uniref:nucleolin isoform X1 n=1 Tax=Erpetoichthys calabaricus TaxID=27687 RepID=UPI0022344287|nr:nucleolin isoform X1 [Erpetoichthys calabaricus]
MVKLAKANKKQLNPKKAAPPPPKEVESSEDEDISEEEEEEEEMVPQPKVKGNKLTPAKASKAAKNGKLAKKQVEEEEEVEDDDDENEDSEASDSEDEESAPNPKKGKAIPVHVKAMSSKKATPAKKAESSEEDEDDDDEEATVSPPKKATPAKQGAAVTMTKKTPAPKAGMKVTPAKSNVAAAKDEESEEEEDEDDSEEDSEEEEAMDITPAVAVQGKKAAKAKPKDDSEEEEDDDDDDDDEEEEEDEDEEEAPQKAGKRKKPEPAKAATPPAKKIKSEGESFALFVGNLNTAKTFEENKDALRSFFTKKGLEVQDIRIGYNRKFGYVDFASEEQLLKALEFNGKKVLGQEIRLDKAKSKDDPSGRKGKDSRTLFVKNLPFSSSSDDLKELFPNAVDVRMPYARDGSSRGIAYIEFKTEAETQKMMKEKQGTEIEGRAIMLDFIGAKSNKTGGAKTLIVNNLAYSATEDSLQNKFEKAVSCRIPQNNGRSRGFAFVEFESAEDAKEALDNFNNTEIEGRTVRLEFSQGNQKSEGGRGAGGPTKTLFVRGLSEDTTDQTLKDSFDGAVAARVATDKDTGSSKGFGFVDFDTEEECKAAKESMEDCEIDGSKVTLDFAKPKGDGQRGGRGGGRGGRGGFGRGGFRGRGGSRGGFGGRGGGFGGRPQGKKIKFDD